MNKEKKILILGAGKDNLDFIRCLKKEFGAFVIATDFIKSAEGASLSDKFIHASYLDKDVILEQLVRKPMNKSINHILMGTTCQNAYPTKLYLENKLGLNEEVPVQNAMNCIDKTELDRLLIKIGLPNLNTKNIEQKKYINTAGNPKVVKSKSGKNLDVSILKPGESIFLKDNEKHILQDYVDGEEYRIDLFPGGSTLVLKKLQNDVYEVENNERIHQSVVPVIAEFDNQMGFENAIVKYDVIVKDVPYIIDIGFDYPIRFCGLLNSHYIDFVHVLLEYYLLNKNNFDRYVSLIVQKPTRVKGLQLV